MVLVTSINSNTNQKHSFQLTEECFLDNPYCLSLYSIVNLSLLPSLADMRKPV